MEPLSGVGIQEASKYASLFFKLSNYFLKRITQIKKYRGPLSGIWCVCWQHDDNKPDEFEIGSMVLYQFRSTITGKIYHGDTYWPFRGNFDYGRLNCSYPHKKDVGNFELRLTDDGLNWDRLKGTWSGQSRVDGVLKKVYGLSICASRGDFYNSSCTVRTFKNSVGGDCLRI